MNWLRQLFSRGPVYGEDDSRQVWHWRSFEGIFMDVRYGIRVLRKNRGFTIVAITSLALAIGANTAIFSLLNGLALRDLPVPQPEQLVRFGAQSGEESFVALSLPLFEQISSGQRVFSSTFGWWGDNLSTVEINGALSRNDIWAVTANFYSELGATPELGRLIGPEDDDLRAASPTPVAVLAYSFWQRHYGEDRSVIGKVLKIEGAAFTIIGVTRPGFTGINADRLPEIIIPLTAEPLLAGDSDVQKHLRRADAFLIEAAGRLKPGVRFDAARAQLESIWPAIRDDLAPANLAPAERSRFLGLRLKIEPGEKGASALRKQFTKPLYVLLAISGLVLLVACVNLATLTLSRAAARGHEIAVRVALGASRTRLVRQALTESIMLSVTGTLVGFLLAYWWSRTLADFILGQFFNAPAQLNLTPDLRVLLSTATVAILTGVLFGLAPAWRSAREDPNFALQSNAKKFSRSTGTLGKSLIVTQVALSLMLLAAAGLFLRTLKKLRTIEPGYQANGVLDASLYPKPGGYKNLDWVNYYRELTSRISRIPGVESAGIAKMSLGWRAWREDVRASETSDAVKVNLSLVMPGFFQTVGIYPRAGRIFTWRDDDHAPRVAVVSESFAKRLFTGREAIGQHLEITSEPTWQKVEIVGIVSNASLYDIRERAALTVYLPTTQYGEYMGWSQMMLRTKAAPGAMANAVRETVDSMGHEYVAKTHLVVETIDRSILRERVFAILSAFFGALALLLAGIGLYGLMAYNVTRRTQEIGVRVALGAAPKDVLSMILRETLGLTSIGIVLGLVCALAAAQVVAGMLYGVSAQDPLTLAAVSIVLTGVAALAGWIPARRAMRVDPMVALRYE